LPLDAGSHVQLYATALDMASFVGAVCAGFILAQSPGRRATQLAALIALGGAWWTHCEAMWNLASERESALLWMRLSTVGWAFPGALVTHLMQRYAEEYPIPALRAKRRLLILAKHVAYATGAVVMVLVWADDWVQTEVHRVPWGWSYQPGPAQILFFGITVPACAAALVSVASLFRSGASAAGRIQRVWIWTGILTPCFLIAVTDALLPLLRVPFPRLGSASFTVLGLIALGTALYYGFSFISPKRFSDEILEALEEGVAMVNAVGAVLRANGEFARLVGRSPGELTGRELTSLLELEPGAGTALGGATRGSLLHAGGERIPVAVSRAVLGDRRSNAVGVVVVVRDLREVEDLRRRMLVQARLAAVGELAAGLAHEMNNPLAFVRANLAMIERHWKTLTECRDLAAEDHAAIAEEGSELLEESITGIDRASEIIHGVRGFTHAGRSARELADVNELVEDALSMARPQFKSAEVTVEYHAGELPPVLCAPQELRQVFLNLIVNAAHALEGKGMIRITTSADADSVAIDVCDDGHGIPPEILESVFDPFFTTKPVGEGTGLGLGIAYQIVDRHGGEITVHSEPGCGTQFCVRLPAARASS